MHERGRAGRAARSRAGGVVGQGEHRSGDVGGDQTRRSAPSRARPAPSARGPRPAGVRCRGPNRPIWSSRLVSPSRSAPPAPPGASSRRAPPGTASVPVEPVVPAEHGVVQVAQHQRRTASSAQPSRIAWPTPAGSRSSRTGRPEPELPARRSSWVRLIMRSVAGSSRLTTTRRPSASTTRSSAAPDLPSCPAIGWRRTAPSRMRARGQVGTSGTTLRVSSGSAPGATGPPRCPAGRCAGGCSAAGRSPSGWRTSRSRRRTRAAGVRRSRA